MRRRRKLQDHQHLQTSTLATHPNDHPDVSTPQSVCWRLQLPACQLGYNTTSADGESLDSWATSNNLGLLYNPKETASFFSRRWNVGRPGLRKPWPGQLTAGQTGPRKVPVVKTLALPHNAKTCQDSRFLPTAIRWSVGTFARLIGSAFALSQVNPSRDCHLWTQQTLITVFLREPDISGWAMHPTWPSEELCTMLRQRVWDSVSLLHPSTSEDWLWQSRFVHTISARREKRGVAVNSIDFSHSSRKAWRTINKLTGRSGRSSHLCPVSANSIASQLVKNGAHRAGDCESSRFVNKELFDLWKTPTPEGHSISERFRPEELAAAPRPLMQGKSPGIGLHLPGVYTPHQVGSHILVLQLPYFLHAPNQNSKDLEKSTNSCDP